MAEDQATTPRGPQDFEKVLDKSASEVASFETRDTSPLARFHHFLHANPTAAPVVVLVVSCLVFGVVANNFFSAFNLSLIIQQVTIIGILGAAQTLVILTAGIDLSVAAIMVLSYMVMARLAVQGDVPSFLAVLIGLGVGLACGLFNGSLVTRTRLVPVALAVLTWVLLYSFGLPLIYVVPIGIFAALAVGWFSFGPALEVRLPPFIVTLGAWSIFFALNLWYSESETIRSQDIDATAPLLKLFGLRVEILGAQFTLGSFLMVGIFIVLWYALNWTAWGRSVYAVGDDKEAAELSGIRTDRVLLSVYGTAGLLCAIGGWAAIGRVGSASPQSFYEGNLDAITAVVIGGTSLFGGRGAIFGTLFGALIVGVFRSGLKLGGVDVLWQTFAVGLLIIVAVAMDQWIRRVSA
ncbi:ABC transporter permease [Pelagibius sp.]|uniref:ABC transporter permease n=1 Tax=Pelagibius sp. TaxID=1931238 RepID=UPI002612DF6B|nr:ABC transporter permease [Pelagibius sp.]